MSFQQLLFDRVLFYYDSLSEPIFSDLSLRLGTGFTGIVGPNGAGKSTLLRLATGELRPQAGQIHTPGSVIHCAQRTDNAPSDLQHLLEATDSQACRIRGHLQVNAEWHTRWETLSHGERKRAQIAVALWQEPTTLALDEPTNHVDEEGRRWLIEALQDFRGIGLVVSHDRELLDTLCVRTLWMDPPHVLLQTGNYSRVKAQREVDHAHRCQTRAQIKQKLGRVNQEKATHRKAADQSQKRRSKRGLVHRDHDQRARRDLARLTGKDGQPGRRLKRLSAKEQRLQTQLAQTQIQKQSSYRIALTGKYYRGDHLLRVPSAHLQLNPHCELIIPELNLTPTDRIGLVGSNGTGKSTLIHRIVHQLTLPPSRFVYLPQEITENQAREVVTSVRTLSKSMLGELMTFIGCLGSNPKRILETELPSPGETRKLLLALGMLQCPYLIIMDEPTNHLDLPSIEAMEQALQACTCALLLVSHDHIFLQTLTTTTWQITPSDNTPTIHYTLTIKSSPL